MSEATREPGDDPALLEVAGSVAGGEAVDWQAAEAQAGAERGPVVRALKLIAKIAEVHRSLQRTLILEDSGSFAAPSGKAPSMPARWGDLELLERVGEGASADVYRARDTRLQREVALKLLRRSPSRGETGNEAVLREGRLLAKVRHSNVATVYGVDEHDGRVGVSMEYVRGKTLNRLIAEQGPQSAREASGLGIDLCRALAAVHEKGVVHRDLKAQNVMREEGGRTLLVDFGIGRDLGAEDDGAPSLSGTPLYLAPEIFERRPATVQSDLYSLGVLLFYLVTGKFPVMGGSLAELRDAHLEGRVALLRDLRPDLPAWFVQAVEKALARDPAARFGSAGQMERALEAGVGPARGEAPAERPRRRLALRLTLIAAALLIVVASSWWALRERPVARAQRLFEEAKRLYDNSDVQGALEKGMRSVELDPTNPRMQILMATLYSATGQMDKERAAAELARQFADRLPPAEKHKVIGDSFLVQLNYERAVAEYGEARRLDPGDQLTLRRLAMIEAKLGKPRRAVELLANSCGGDEANWVSCGELCLATAQDRGVEAGLALLASLPVELRETKSNVGWSEGVIWLAAGDLDRAEQSFERLAQADDAYATEGSMFLSEVDLLRGRLYEAKQDLAKGFAVDTRGNQTVTRWRRLLALAELALALEDTDEATRQLDQLGDLPQAPQAARTLARQALLEVRVDRFNRALALSRELDALQRLYDGNSSLAALALQVRGSLALAQGDAKQARDHLEAALHYRDEPLIREELARAFESLGELQDAVSNRQEIDRLKVTLLNENLALLWVTNLSALARLHERLGQREEAVSRYQQFLSHWGENARDLPLVQEAKAALDRLSPR